METNESLSLETFPKRYEACFLENCAVREDCLHHLYFKLQPASNTGSVEKRCGNFLN